jgi:Holliday junction resolvasome RuvABC ATP-dependent DNA helicase subunit
VVLDFEPYIRTEIAQILSLRAAHYGLRLDNEAVTLIAGHCQGTPGHADAILSRIGRHYGAVAARSPINGAAAEGLLDLLGFNKRELPTVTLADRLRLMSGTEFEQFVADLFGGLGYSVN